MVFLKAQMSGQMNDPEYLIKCLIADYENTILKANKKANKEELLIEETYGSKLPSSAEEANARFKKVKNSWTKMKKVGGTNKHPIKTPTAKIHKKNWGRKYKYEEGKIKIGTGKDAIELKRNSIILVEDMEDVDFKISSKELISSIDNKLLDSLNGILQDESFKEFMSITNLANFINKEKKNIPISFTTDAKNKKLQILDYFNTVGKNRITEIYNRIKDNLDSAKKELISNQKKSPTEKNKYSKALALINKTIISNYTAFSSIVHAKKPKIKNISGIEEFETSDVKIKSKTATFYAELANDIDLLKFKEDTKENEDYNRTQVAKLFKGRNPQLVFNILTNLNASQEKVEQVFGTGDDKISDLVRGNSGDRKPNTEEDPKKRKELEERVKDPKKRVGGYKPESKEKVERRDMLRELTRWKAKSGRISKAELNKLFNLVDISGSGINQKVIFRSNDKQAPYGTGTVGFGKLIKNIKAITTVLAKEVGNTNVLDIFTKFGEQITQLKKPKSAIEPNKKEGLKTALSNLKRNLAKEKRELSKEERNLLSAPSLLQREIKELTGELAEELTNFNNIFLLTTPMRGRVEGPKTGRTAKNTKMRSTILTLTKEHPAYWYKKIDDFAGKEGEIEDYYKQLAIALKGSKLNILGAKNDKMIQEENELKEKLEDISEGLSSNKTKEKMDNLLRISIQFERLREPYKKAFAEYQLSFGDISDSYAPNTEKYFVEEANRQVDKYILNTKGEKSKELNEAITFLEEKGEKKFTNFYIGREDIEDNFLLEHDDEVVQIAKEKGIDEDKVTVKDLETHVFKDKTPKEIEAGEVKYENIKFIMPTKKPVKMTTGQKDYIKKLKHLLKNTIKRGPYTPKEKTKEKITETPFDFESTKALLLLEDKIIEILAKNPEFKKIEKTYIGIGDATKGKMISIEQYKQMAKDSKKVYKEVPDFQYMTGISIKGDIEQENLSILEILDNDFTMNTDTAKDYGELEVKLRELSKRIDASEKLYDKMKARILEIQGEEEE